MTAHDQENFIHLYHKYYKKLLYTALDMLKNISMAEDLTNETFTILLTQFDRIQHHPNIGGWLHTVLTNLALNELKKQSRYVPVPTEELYNIGHEADMFVFDDFLPAGLSSADKKILHLRFQENLNCAEIARCLDISHDASRARLSRAKRRFAELILQDKSN